MAFRIHVSGYWRWVWAPVSFVLVMIASSLAQNSVDKTVQDAQINTSLWPWLLPWSDWLLTNWWGLTGWVLLFTLVLAVWFTYRDDRKYRAARILEHYSVHLQMHRKFVLDENRTKEQLQDVARWINDLRGTLMNHTPKTFTVATADAFRKPDVISLTDARKLVEGMSEQVLRENLLAHIDRLLSAVATKWLAYDGMEQEENL